MDDAELQALLNSGDPEEIDKALKYLDENKEDVSAEPSSGNQGTEQDAADKGNDVNAGSSPTDNAAPKGIASKNGEHVLPYDVLDRERRENQELKRQLEESDRQLRESRTLSDQATAINQKVELLQNQLTKHGIKPAQLAEELQLTEEDLEGLEDYDNLGEVSAKTARKLMALEKQFAKLTEQYQTAPAQATNTNDADNNAITDINAAIDATDGMREVMSNPNYRDKAVAIDEQLKAMPQFAGKTLEQRFSEVMKRMAPVILKGSDKRGNKEDDDFDDIKPPHSLNGIAGATPDVNAPISQQLAGLNDDEIQHRLMQMTDAQRNQVMQELGL